MLLNKKSKRVKPIDDFLKLMQYLINKRTKYAMMRIMTFKKKIHPKRKTIIGKISLLKKPKFITEMNDDYKSLILGG